MARKPATFDEALDAANRSETSPGLEPGVLPVPGPTWLVPVNDAAAMRAVRKISAARPGSFIPLDDDEWEAMQRVVRFT